MRIAIDIGSWTSMLAFLGASAAVVRGALRDRERVGIRLAFALGLLGACALGAHINHLLPSGSRVLANAIIIAFTASGYALLEYRGSIVALAPVARIAAAALCALSAGFGIVAGVDPRTVGTPLSAADLTIRYAYLVVWSCLVLEASIRIWIASSSRGDVDRARMRLLSTGYLGILCWSIFAIPLRGAVAGTGTGALLTQIFQLALVPLLAAAVAPPAELRRFWLRRAGERRARSQVQIGTWSWDLLTGQFTWSDEMRRMVGHPAEAACCHAAGLLTIVHPADRDALEQLVETSFASGSPYVVDHRVVLPDGTVRWLQTHGEVVADPATGHRVALFGTSVDVTERRENEAATQAAYEREREAARELRALRDAKNAFLTAVSHEIRTPLTVVLAVASVLDEHDGDLPAEKRADLTKRLMRNSRRLERLLLDLLDLDRLKRGTIEPKRRPTSVDQLIDRVLDSVDTAGRDVVVDADAEGAWIDPAHVERVIENLLVNALRHTPPGVPLWIRAWRNGLGLELAVDDAGQGIPQDMKDAMSEPFGRQRGTKGTGVGLSLVVQFARLNGGDAWIEDRPGGGASFRVSMPYVGAGPVAHAG